MFIISATVLVTAVLLLIAWPVLRNIKRQPPAVDGAENLNAISDLETEKENMLASLRDLESDLQGGKLSEADFNRLRDIDEHRLAEILDRIDSVEAATEETHGNEGMAGTAVPAAGFRTMNMAGLIVLVIIVAGGASGTYYYQNIKHQGQDMEAMMENQGGPESDGTANPLEMVTRLERKLRENPNDLEGQILAGRSYMTMQRSEEARKAWIKVTELDPNNVEAHYSLGYLQIQTASPGNTDSFELAIGHLEKALQLSPGLPAALYYKGLALAHLKRYDEAVRSWESAIQGLPPGSEDSEFVKDALRKLKSGNL